MPWPKGVPLSEETRCKMSEVRRGRRQTPEHVRARFAAGAGWPKGMKHTVEAKHKMSESLRGHLALRENGRRNVAIATIAASIARRGRKLSDEHRAKIASHSGVCELCGEAKSKGIVRDHDHETGVYRGRLCRTCNLMIAGVELAMEMGSEKIKAWLARAKTTARV